MIHNFALGAFAEVDDATRQELISAIQQARFPPHLRIGSNAMGVWTGWRGVLRMNEDPQHIGFWCPGCKTLHVYDERWKMDPKSTFEKPTFKPSLNNTTGHYVQGAPRQADGTCWWCEDAKERGKKTHCSVCHLWITDGIIDFLPDCTHELRGQKVAMTVRDDG